MQIEHTRSRPARLNESPETLASIVRLANFILRIAGDNGAAAIRAAYERYHGYTNLYLDGSDLPAVTLDQLPRKFVASLETGFGTFIKAMVEKHLRIAFTDNGNLQGRKAGGWFRSGSGYRQPEIMLVVDTGDFEPIKTAFHEYPQRLDGAIRDVMRKLTDILIHELTHAYDEWASKGRWKDNARTQSAQTAEVERQFNRSDNELAQTAHALYMNSPIEINARYMAAVAALEAKNQPLSWPAYKSSFEWSMPGWRKLPDEDKRRLLTRLATQWQAGRNTLQHDVAGACRRLQDRLQAAGHEVWLSSRNENAVLSVDNVTLKKPEQVAALLRPILVLADHYGMTVALQDKLPIPAVRPLGFVNQRPRSVNGGKRDYSLPLGTVYFRRPVDRRQAAT